MGWYVYVNETERMRDTTGEGVGERVGVCERECEGERVSEREGGSERLRANV